MLKDEALAVAKQWALGYDSNLDTIEPPYENYHFSEIDPNEYFIFSYGSKRELSIVESVPLVGIKKENGRIKYFGRIAVDSVPT